MATQQVSNFVSNARQAADQAAATIRTIRNLLEVYETLGLGPDGARPISDADMDGENSQVTAAQLHAAMAVLDGVMDGLTAEARAAIYGITINPGV